MKRVLLVFLCLLASPLLASHIVGGEFEFLYRGKQAGTGYQRYHLSLILYFDKINGRPTAKDLSVIIKIFRKRDNAIMRELSLDLLTEAAVQYKRPNCSSGSSIKTDRLYYTFGGFTGSQSELVLPPDEFDDPQGYYIAWERCCRNYSITNIYSQDPDTGGLIYAGQAFYLEFPPLMVNDEPFINSSPSLFQPLSDYACPGRLYTVDFSGTDPDGDSLVYSMVVPLNTHTGEAIPFGGPKPAPYPKVNYRSGFGLNNIMKGNPDLKISKTGILSVVPTTAGLYVFAVKCEEFRDGRKIGEIRRDFQMLVLAACPPASPPVVEGKKKSDPTFIKDNLVVSFDQNATDIQRCIEIRVTDPDASTTHGEDIEILAVAVNFENDNIDEVLPDVSTAKLTDATPVSFSICFPECPYTEGTYVLDIVVLNESCGGALTDTIRVNVTVEVPLNNPPVFTPSEVIKTVTEGGPPYSVEFTAEDSDNDDLTLIYPSTGSIDFAKYGFSVQNISTAPGKIVSVLQWDTRCDVFDFSVKREFEFKFEVDDNDKCNVTPNDSIIFKLKRQIDDFHDPVIEYVPDPSLEKITLNKKIYESVSFDVHAFDADVDDVLILSGEGDEFSLPEYGAVFPTQTFKADKIAPFQWYLNCDKIDIEEKDQFHFYLIVRDNQNICGYDLADTLDVTVNVLPPDNLTPQISLNGDFGDMTANILMGEELTVPVMGIDGDTQPQDNLSLELIDATGNVMPEGYAFTSQSPSTTPVNGTFTWKPNCAIFQDENYQNNYVFRFRVIDDRCFHNDADTISLLLNVKDVDSDSPEFLPPNVITPGDNNELNEYFALVKNVDGQIVSILPKDNCQGKFVNITIVNRWGRHVYQSDDRDFKWYAESESGGMYYYLLKYTNREYKGIIHVITGGSESSNR
jgi:hypothetical protein